VHVILWRFRARAGCEAAFEAAYGSEGDWARLFRSDPDYLGTTLMRATDGTYLTVDRWTSGEAARAFRDRNAAAYAALDARSERLKVEETALGTVEI
jgi:hypothetical protein